MRVIINCTDGRSHSLMLTESTTVMDLKHHVARKEGIPPDQQLLVFAGRQLFPDSALLLDHLALDTYSLAHEVVVYMQRQLSEPLRVFLCQPGPGPCKQHTEMVEVSSTLSNIMQLLDVRHLTTKPFSIQQAVTTRPSAGFRARNTSCSPAATRYTGGTKEGASAGSVTLPSCIVVKRQDGSCCSNIHVTESCTLQQLVEIIRQLEDTIVSHLSFYQAPDGCLHVVYGPSADPCMNTHTVYKRSCQPQPEITMVEQQDTRDRKPLSALIKEQAVMP